MNSPLVIKVDPSGRYDFALAPSTEVGNWTTNPLFTLASEDFVTRPARVVTSFVLHNTQGLWPQTIVEGAGPNSQRAENVAAYWRRNKSSASTPLILDTDGSVIQTHYLQPIVAWHAKAASMRSIGAEIVQVTEGGTLYTAPMETAAAIINGLIECNHPKVQLLNPADSTHELPWLEVRTSYPTNGTRPAAVSVERRGVYGHRDVRPLDRGRGDPGDAIMARVAEALIGWGKVGAVRYQVVAT